MIKEAEVHHAYLLGRQAAMEKLAKDQDKKEEDDKSDSKKKDKDPRFEGTKALLEELQKHGTLDTHIHQGDLLALDQNQQGQIIALKQLTHEAVKCEA